MRDLQLLRGELVAGVGRTAPARLSRCAELATRLVRPRGAAQAVERVAGGAQRRSRVGDPPLAPQPLPVAEPDLRVLERPRSQAGVKRGLVAGLGIAVVGQEG